MEVHYSRNINRHISRSLKKKEVYKNTSIHNARKKRWGGGGQFLFVCKSPLFFLLLRTVMWLSCHVM